MSSKQKKFKPLRPKITYEEDGLVDESENVKQVDGDDSNVDYDEQHWDDIPRDD